MTLGVIIVFLDTCNKTSIRQECVMIRPSIPCPENCFKFPYLASMVGTWYTIQCLKSNVFDCYSNFLYDSVILLQDIHVGGDKLALVSLQLKREKVPHPLLCL